MAFREKGIASGVQIEDYHAERNPYDHTAQDSMARMNLEYWQEQMKAAAAIAAQLAVPVTISPAEPITMTHKAYFPVLWPVTACAAC